MFRVHDKYDQKYDELRTIAENEKKTPVGYYGAVLRLIISDINIREGNFQQAIYDLTQYTDFYKDTDMKVEMPGRIAEIYGIYLNDKEQALQYAQKAAAINSGQLSLSSAFNADDVEYETAMYEKGFKDVTCEIVSYDQIISIKRGILIIGCAAFYYLNAFLSLFFPPAEFISCFIGMIQPHHNVSFPAFYTLSFLYAGVFGNQK